MIKSIVKFSVFHPLSILSLILGLCLLGIFSLLTLKADFLPEINRGELLVITEYAGLGVKDMEKLVTTPLEEGLASLEGMKKTSSVTRDGLSAITIQLHWGQDVDLALIKCREIIDTLYTSLPWQCKKPMVSVQSGINEAMGVAVVPKRGSVNNRYFIEKEVKTRYQRLENSGNVFVFGGLKDEVHIMVDYNQLESQKFSLNYIASVLEKENFQYPAGTIDCGEKEFLVKTTGVFTSLEEVESCPLLYNDSPILLSHIAQVQWGSQDQQSFFTYNGREGFYIGIQKKQGGNPLSLSREVIRETEKLKLNYGADYEFIPVYDLSSEIKKSLASVILSALTGAVITGIVIFYFLKSHRLALLLSGLIPLCFLMVLFILTLLGKTLNIMSLSGVAVGVGMVVDAGAVILENLSKKNNFLPRTKFQEHIVKSVMEVSASNLGGTVTTIVVFLPMFFIPGLLGELFSDLAIGVISSVFFSWFLSLTYIPAMYYLLFGSQERCNYNKNNLSKKFSKEIIPVNTGFSKKTMEVWESYYEKLLWKFFQNKKYRNTLILVTLIICVISLWLSTFSLLPELKGEYTEFYIRLPSGSSMEYMKEVATIAEKLLSDLDEVEVLWCKGGFEKDNLHELAQIDFGKEIIQVTVKTKTWQNLSREKIYHVLGNTNTEIIFLNNKDILSSVLNIPPVSYLVQNKKGDFTEKSGFSETEDLKSSRLEEDFRLFDSLNPEILNGWKILPQEYAKEIIFTPNRLCASRFGFSADVVTNHIQALLNGVYTSPYYSRGREIPMVVRLPSGKNTQIKDLERMSLFNSQGRFPLGTLGDFSEEYNEKVVFHYNGLPGKILYPPDAGNACPADIQNTCPADIQNTCPPDTSLLKSIKSKFPDISITDVRREEFKETFSNAFFLIVAGLILLYLVMGALFESFTVPVLMFIALPPTLSGTLFFTLLWRCDFSVNTMIAFIVLLGIVINNSIILYENCLTLKQDFSAVHVFSKCKEKLRAILITNFTTVFALLPFTFDPLGVNSQSSVAIGIIGGVLFSLLFVLCIFPIVLVRHFERRKIHE